MNYANIQQILKQVKGVAIHYVKYLVRSMLGFLTFVLTHLEYIQLIEICDTFLTFLPRGKSNCQFIHIIWMKVFDQSSEMKTTEEIEHIVTEILPMFHSSVKLKFLPGNFESLAWIFRNFTNIFFNEHYLYDGRKMGGSCSHPI
jgi:hypothetical protein